MWLVKTAGKHYSAPTHWACLLDSTKLVQHTAPALLELQIQQRNLHLTDQCEVWTLGSEEIRIVSD